MTRFIDELREKKSSSGGRKKTAFSHRKLDFCHAIDYRPNPVIVEEFVEEMRDTEQMFLILVGAVDLLDLKLTITRNNAFEHTQVSITRKASKSVKLPTVVNIRAENGETALAIAAGFINDYATEDWRKL